MEEAAQIAFLITFMPTNLRVGQAHDEDRVEDMYWTMVEYTIMAIWLIWTHGYFHPRILRVNVSVVLQGFNGYDFYLLTAYPWSKYG
jgi:uncharacterized membrane protein YpjA